MIDLEWLSDRLVAVLRWQLANPGREDGPEVPWAGRRVWGIFLALNATRTAGMGSPIAYAEIEAYGRVRREPVRDFEVEIIRALDAAYLEAARQQSEAGTGAPNKVSARPMSTELFDALFAGDAPKAKPAPPSYRDVAEIFRRAAGP